MSLCLFYYWSALFGALAIAPDLKWKLEMHSHLFASLGTLLLFLFSLAFKPPAVCNDKHSQQRPEPEVGLTFQCALVVTDTGLTIPKGMETGSAKL